ncbi:unnamed protein product [Protopolystoma xenopodis]|uniref:Ig-like domain-containing protein n=1 Tax=Protopolystoma xenopodis TaxID=117903 RepID=A0A3S5CUR6_9PLAT|nr:unnamed protein product [Protopolystoma xenopodis]
MFQTMSLSNLTVEDRAVIQCNASNSYGYAYTNAFINVMLEPPFIINPPQAYIRVAEGFRVVINCETLSAPAALVSWSKEGRQINGGRYQKQASGSLLIEVIKTGLIEDIENIICSLMLP